MPNKHTLNQRISKHLRQQLLTICHTFKQANQLTNWHKATALIQHPDHIIDYQTLHDDHGQLLGWWYPDPRIVQAQHEMLQLMQQLQTTNQQAIVNAFVEQQTLPTSFAIVKKLL